MHRMCYVKNKSRKKLYRKDKNVFRKSSAYGLSEKGVVGVMELEDFIELIDTTDVSSQAVLKQRLELNGKMYLNVMQANLRDSYHYFIKDMKLFNGYILTAIDERNVEIPKVINNFNEYDEEELGARVTVSNMFDVLNHYVMDTIIEKCDYSERTMAQRHYETIKNLKIKYPIIRTEDRSYLGIIDIHYALKADDKFVYRIEKTDFKRYIPNMETNDEIITMPYQYEKIGYYEKECPEFYKIMEEAKEDIKIRVIKINDKEGKEIVLVTNLEKEKFDYNTMIELYKLRWENEDSYNLLKESLKIDAITSSLKTIVEQDICSQMLAFNIIEVFVNDAIKGIDQTKYKNEVKIDMNMAVGFVKKALILITIEENKGKQEKMFELLGERIRKYIIPIKKD